MAQDRALGIPHGQSGGGGMDDEVGKILVSERPQEPEGKEGDMEDC